ncbi:toxin-antitoxin system YwqK family antitoxin [Halopseudomonas salegens]|uniref:Uncharacterized protein n=1 Tax=Halopseudomonas salegens TaxID=1434072 RepID=A0A1H2HYM3_9GAMM|nr:hypothetical protein [Halopseudomonas salegens]SDU36826.1 hypothetical protein SAMN05216210_3406 [Halopseudomonas salegens]
MSRIPQRPLNIPSDAQWNASDQMWQLGQSRPRENDDPALVGERRYWYEDGSMAGIEYFDEEGQLNGTSTWYHPDGTLASQGEFRNGLRFGHFIEMQSENETPHYYTEDERTWRVEFDATKNWSEENIVYFLKDGTECTSTGRPLTMAFDLDPIFDGASPHNFIEGDGLRILQLLAEESENPSSELPETLGLDTVFGYKDQHVAPFLQLINTAGVHKTSPEGVNNTVLAPIRLPGYGAWGTQDGSTNLMEWFLRNCDAGMPGMAFNGAYWLGGSGDCNGWCIGLFDRDAEHGGSGSNECKPQIYFWDHDIDGFEQPQYGSLDDFLWHLCIEAACYQERLSEEAAKRARMQQFVEPQKSMSDTCFFQFRAYWLTELMKYTGSTESPKNRLRYLNTSFNSNLNKPINEEVHQARLRTGKDLPPTALYTLWRYFWFGHEARLREALDAYREAPAKLTRDCVALIEELLAERNTLPGIPDVRALRAALLTLDLDPDRKSEREAEQAALAEQKLAALTAEIPALQQQGLDALIERAWDVVDDKQSLQLLAKEVSKDARLGSLFIGLNWIKRRKQAEYNNPRSPIDDAYHADLGSWLESQDHRPAQAWMWPTATHLTLVLKDCVRRPGVAHPRLIEAALRELGIASEYNFSRERAATLLGCIQEQRAIPALLALFEEYQLNTADLSNDELRSVASRWEGCLSAAAEALCKIHRAYPNLPAADTAKHMHAIANDHYTAASLSRHHRMDNAAIACLRTLGSLGDPRTLMAMPSLYVARGDDAIGRMLALRELAHKHPGSRREIAEGQSDERCRGVMLAHALMLNAAIKGFDFNNALVFIEDNGYLRSDRKEWRLYWLLLCEAIAESTLPTDLIANLLYSGDRDVREAAQAALHARQSEVPRIRALSPIEAEDIVITQGTEGALQLFCDPHTIGLHYVLEAINRQPALVDMVDDRVVAALIDALVRDLDRLPQDDSIDLEKQTSTLLEVLMPHSGHLALIDPVARYIAHPSANVVLAVLPLAQPQAHVADVLSAYARLYESSASKLAQWLLTHAQFPGVQATIEAAGLTVKKLSSVAR